jgi:hypothetical protein
MQTMQDILTKIHVTNSSCWEWLGRINEDGYGKYGNFYIHRIVYEFYNDVIPEELDHLCRNRSCCNPTHLQEVSHRVNILRGQGVCAINARKTHCKRGHEFTKENTLLVKNGRNCKSCRAITNSKWQKENR